MKMNVTEFLVKQILPGVVYKNWQPTISSENDKYNNQNQNK